MTDRSEYKREFVKNYNYVKMNLRKGLAYEDEIFEFLQTKENVSNYLKGLVQTDMAAQKEKDAYMRKIGWHPLEDLIQSEDWKEFRHCYTIGDVQEKLDRMNTSRETHYFDKDGKDCGYYGGLEFLQNVARPDINGCATWYGWEYCGPNLKSIVRCEGYDWNDEEQTFLGIGQEIIGYDW